ncbi:MAG: DNA repair protein RecO [Coriobacteriales bacterium]|jgi:DNA repair protein RecO (recombination protein O)|nr:DNA repair protein RecO [Coriobacteriales bacterium]
MPTEQAEVLVLKKTKLGETDLIVTCFADSGTQVRAVVKGGRKPGAKLGAHLELFSHSRVLLYKGSRLDTVTEAEVVEAHRDCLQDPEHTAAASVLAELLEFLSRDADADPRLFHLTDAAFHALGQTEIPGLKLLLAASLLKQASQSGFMPSLRTCVGCGSDVADGSDDGNGNIQAMGFDFEQGGVLCHECMRYGEEAHDDQGYESPVRAPRSASAVRNNGRHTGSSRGAHRWGSQPIPVIPIVSVTLDWLETMIRSKYVDLLPFANSDYQAIAEPCLNISREWVATHITRRLRSLDFFCSIS